MNWFTHSRSDLVVGFGKDGGVCEGGNCEHLKHGDKAYGQSSENDPWGSESYLMCQKCFEAFVEARKVEPIDCDDCGRDVPRNKTVSHIPYYVDEFPREKWKKVICEDCQKLPRHLRRLAIDEEEREQDRQRSDELDDWMPDVDEEEPPADDFEDFIDEPESLPLTVFDRNNVPQGWTDLYSATIKKIVVYKVRGPIFQEVL